jgi:hypothetical protein
MGGWEEGGRKGGRKGGRQGEREKKRKILDSTRPMESEISLSQDHKSFIHILKFWKR